MLVPNLIVINYPKPTTGANALYTLVRGGDVRQFLQMQLLASKRKGRPNLPK
jgi:hypothetical protein